MVISYTAFFLVQPQDACEKKLEKVMDEQEQKEKEEVMEDKKNQEEKGLCFSRAYALKEWGTSLRKAQLLAHVPLPELKRRRFVGKEAETNPFLEMVEKAAPQDVD